MQQSSNGRSCRLAALQLLRRLVHHVAVSWLLQLRPPPPTMMTTMLEVAPGSAACPVRRRFRWRWWWRCLRPRPDRTGQDPPSPFRPSTLPPPASSTSLFSATGRSRHSRRRGGARRRGSDCDQQHQSTKRRPIPIPIPRYCNPSNSTSRPLSTPLRNPTPTSLSSSGRYAVVS